MGMPQDSSPKSSLPRWVIPTAVAGAVLSFALVVGITGSLMWVTAHAQQLIVAQPEIEAPEAPAAPEMPGAPVLPEAPVTPEAPDAGSADDSRSAAQIAQELQALTEAYLDAQRDGTIYGLVPGGEKVDPAYIGGFLYAMTDLKSASRFGGSAGDLLKLLDKAKLYEERFLAGEDLDVNVRIVREDGSVFESDGVYRLIE